MAYAITRTLGFTENGIKKLDDIATKNRFAIRDIVCGLLESLSEEQIVEIVTQYQIKEDKRKAQQRMIKDLRRRKAYKHMTDDEIIEVMRNSVQDEGDHNE